MDGLPALAMKRRPFLKTAALLAASFSLPRRLRAAILFTPRKQTQQKGNMPHYPHTSLSFSPSPLSGEDGGLSRSSVDETFSTLRAGAGVGTLSSSPVPVELDASTTTNQFNFLSRGVISFNTSALGAGVNIKSATLKIKGSSKLNGLGSPDFHIAGITLASPPAFVAADFANAGNVSFASMTYADFDGSASVYNSFALNSSGMDAINKTGYTSFCIRLSWDINNNFTGVWSSGQLSKVNFYLAAEGGDLVPLLEIVYTRPLSHYPGNYL
jgi:hypothetical protein